MRPLAGMGTLEGFAGEFSYIQYSTLVMPRVNKVGPDNIASITIFDVVILPAWYSKRQ
jgi:hypothetical protein